MCEHCHSDEVLQDAWAEWDAENQIWSLHSTFDDYFCVQCDGPTKIIEIEKEG